MRIAVGADHAGYLMKEHIGRMLSEAGHAVVDVGTYSEDPVDYPDYAAAVSRMVREGRADRGIVVCGSGAGAAIAANKLHGIRAALSHDTYSAHQSVEHDDANVLAMGSKVIGSALADEIVVAFINARFDGEERHVRRLNKVIALEEQG
ncbi:ribose-5-phosphate isomerase B [bacterium BMS3Abin02]|nr:ribose-5-phosphate isomerase B [bacterium BMS3Abin02]GBE22434.1 ribose-5-phosphate isomerase B [bacterium BMS3Bbin01]